MGLFDQFPYTNFHELNLDWILQALKELEHTIDQFVSINALKYADPIQWDITSQYEKNTIVIDPQTGTAYISVQPVPIGVALTNPDYWTVVFDLGSFVVRAAKNLANTYEAETTLTATVSTAAGGWIVWGDTLYKALVNITAGDSYIDGGNISHFTIEDVIGHLEDLTTTDKSNLVAAINEVAAEVLGKIGDLDDLVTSDKSNLVAAINEVANEVLGKIGELDDLNTTDKSNLVAAINEVNTTGGGALALIGDLDDLNTTDKSNLVAAINEVDTNINNLSVFVTPEMYGAVGDGVTDDTQALIDALASGLPVICDNTYLLTSVVTLPNNATIIGRYGMYGYVPTFKTTNGGFTVNGSTRHITIKGIYSVSQGSSETFFNYPSGNGDRNYHFENMRIDNYRVGFLINGTLWDSVFRNIRIHTEGTGIGTDVGVYIAAANSFNLLFDSMYLDNCKWYSADFQGTFINCNFGLSFDTQIELRYNNTVTFIGCNFECETHIASGILIRMGVGGFVFENCSFYIGGETGALMLDTTSATRILKLINTKIGYKNNNGMTLYRSDYMELATPGAFSIEGNPSLAQYFTGYNGAYLEFSPMLPSTVIQCKDGAPNMTRSMIRYNVTTNKLQYTPDGTTWKNIQFEA